MNIERIGTQYGGWWVDTTHLGPASVVYAFGIGEDLSFDLGLIQQFGTQVWAFDPTPRSINWINQQTLPAQLKVVEMGLLDYDGICRFVPPAHPAHVSFREAKADSTGVVELEVKTLSTLMSELGHNRIDVLKMDIEGAEYPVVKNLVEKGPLIGQILVEFHDFFPNFSKSDTQKSIQLLESAGYQLFKHEGYNYSFIYAP